MHMSKEAPKSVIRHHHTHLHWRTDHQEITGKFAMDINPRKSVWAITNRATKLKRTLALE